MSGTARPATKTAASASPTNRGKRHSYDARVLEPMDAGMNTNADAVDEVLADLQRVGANELADEVDMMIQMGDDDISGVLAMIPKNIKDKLSEGRQMKITKRQLRRIIREEKAKVLAEQKVRRIVRRRLQEDLGSSPTLTLDLGPSGDYPTLGNTATDDTFRVPDFGSSEELMKAVEAALGPVSPDTPVKDYDLGLGTIPLIQLYDKVMEMA